jgi:predicted nuclease of restriction endonuclease-like RecB superfamily
LICQRVPLSYGTGWTLRREPEPLIAGTHVMMADLAFERDGMRVYLEVVGFWTPEYLEMVKVKISRGQQHHCKPSHGDRRVAH